MAIELTIVTPEGQAFSGTVDSVVLPGSEGNFGVLEAHERFLSPLQIGEVEIQTAAGTQWAAISEGFADVNPQRAVVLVETCELASDIDKARAESAKNRAEASLQSKADSEDSHRLQQAALKRAAVRIQVAARL